MRRGGGLCGGLLGLRCRVHVYRRNGGPPQPIKARPTFCAMANPFITSELVKARPTFCAMANPFTTLRFIDPKLGSHILICKPEDAFDPVLRENEGLMQCRGKENEGGCSTACSDECFCQCHLFIIDLSKQRLGIDDKSSVLLKSTVANISDDSENREKREAASVLFDFAFLLMIALQRYAQVKSPLN